MLKKILAIAISTTMVMGSFGFVFADDVPVDPAADNTANNEAQAAVMSTAADADVNASRVEVDYGNEGIDPSDIGADPEVLLAAKQEEAAKAEAARIAAEKAAIAKAEAEKIAAAKAAAAKAEAAKKAAAAKNTKTVTVKAVNAKAAASKKVKTRSTSTAKKKSSKVKKTKSKAQLRKEKQEKYKRGLAAYIRAQNRNLGRKRSLAYATYFIKWGKKYGVRPEALMATAHHESRFTAGAYNSGGYYGMMQTSAVLGRGCGYSPSNLFRASNSIRVGAKYLRMNYKEFGTYRMAFAGYMAGTGGAKRGNYSRSRVNQRVRTMKNITRYLKKYKFV